MAGLLDGYTPDPLAQGLLGLGGALLTPRAMGGGIGPGMQAFAQQAQQAQEARRRMAADAERQAYLRQQSEMQQKRFGMDEQKFGLEMKQYEDARKAAEQKQQFVDDFVRTAAMKDPEIAMLARVDLRAAIERAFPKPEWRTWFDERGRQTQGYAAPGQAPQQVGGVERKMQGVNLGDRYAFVDANEQTAPLTMGQSPDSRASVAATMRGQNMTDARAREGMSLQRELANAKGDEWAIDAARGIQVNKRTGEARPITQDGKPIGAKNDDQVKREQNAKDALKIIDEAEGLLEQSTSGYIGTGVDKAAQAFGLAPKGAIAGGQLKTLQAALMMRMPRMEGPQSNLDVSLYRESVGQIGDTTVPVKIRKEALATVKRLQQQYAGLEPSNTVDFGNVGKVKPGGVINFGDLK